MAGEAIIAQVEKDRKARKEGERYTIREISEASGVPTSTLRQRLYHKKEMKNEDNRYTLEEAKQLIKPRPNNLWNEDRAARLRRALKNDGAI